MLSLLPCLTCMRINNVSTLQARIQAGAHPAPPPKKNKQKKTERERGGEERGSKEETIRSIRGKTSAEAFVISF